MFITFGDTYFWECCEQGSSRCSTWVWRPRRCPRCLTSARRRRRSYALPLKARCPSPSLRWRDGRRQQGLTSASLFVPSKLLYIETRWVLKDVWQLWDESYVKFVPSWQTRDCHSKTERLREDFVSSVSNYTIYEPMKREPHLTWTWVQTNCKKK